MRFSVIIPLYNKVSFVRKAISSVLEQTFQDFELIVVDDGSTDGSDEEARNSMPESEKFKLIRQVNSGVSLARNNGVAVAASSYLCFLDADDWWEPTFLEEMDKLVSAFPDAGIYGTGYNIINETKHRTRVAPIGVDAGFEKGCINYCQAYLKNMGMPLCSSSVCIPRNIFLEMGGFPQNVSLGEDFILWIHIALKYPVVLVNKALSNYNQDIEPDKRAVGRLHSPEHHMLWNLSDLEPEEYRNPDYKHLIDKLRVTGLMPYYLSPSYHEMAKGELIKVNWNLQPKSVKLEYRLPLGMLRFKSRFMKWGARMKTLLKSLAV